MSWFRRKPRKNESHRTQPQPYHSSPMAQKMMERAKETGPLKEEKKEK